MFLVYGEGGGSDAEFECVMLSTLENMKDPMGQGVERDISFRGPQRLSKISASYAKWLSKRAHDGGDTARDVAKDAPKGDSASAQ
jgi:hypothetical protein